MLPDWTNELSATDRNVSGIIVVVRKQSQSIKNNLGTSDDLSPVHKSVTPISVVVMLGIAVATISDTSIRLSDVSITVSYA